MTPVVNSLVTNAECQSGGFVAGFADPADLDPSTAAQQRSWSFRQEFASLSAQDPFDFPLPFPLVPPAGARTQVKLGGTLHAGPGVFVDILHAPRARGGAPPP